jgi:threonine/homoserine/homoserine lactone efflux protein
MPTPATLALFAGACMALLVVPGPSVLYIVTRSIGQGRRAGLVSVLGVEAGALVHVAAAALGLSALLASSLVAFNLVRYLGAAYLVWLGVRALLGRDGHDGREPERPGGVPLGRLFGQGLVVNVLNPKTTLFFLAFLPQFVDPGAGPATPQVLVLGMVWVLLALLSDGCYALLAGALGGRLRRSVAAGRRVGRLAGGVYIGLGAVAALSGGRSTRP